MTQIQKQLHNLKFFLKKKKKKIISFSFKTIFFHKKIQNFQQIKKFIDISKKKSFTCF